MQYPCWFSLCYCKLFLSANVYYYEIKKETSYLFKSSFSCHRKDICRAYEGTLTLANRSSLRTHEEGMWKDIIILALKDTESDTWMVAGHKNEEQKYSYKSSLNIIRYGKNSVTVFLCIIFLDSTKPKTVWKIFFFKNDVFQSWSFSSLQISTKLKIFI